jgi:hypothetical protein
MKNIFSQSKNFICFKKQKNNHFPDFYIINFFTGVNNFFLALKSRIDKFATPQKLGGPEFCFLRCCINSIVYLYKIVDLKEYLTAY